MHFNPTALTFREEQCAAYNHRTDLFKNFPGPMDWVPRYTGVAPRDQCKLTCQTRALGYYYVLEPRVRTRMPGGLVCAHSLPQRPSAFWWPRSKTALLLEFPRPCLASPGLHSDFSVLWVFGKSALDSG